MSRLNAYWDGRLRSVMVLFAVLSGTFLALVPASGSVHAIYIKEVYGGSPADPNAQFVELQMFASGQNFTANRDVNIYSSANVLVGSFRFPANVANPSDLATILIATSQAQSVFGVPADLTMTPVIASSGGKACFTGSGDCVSWGNYSGDATGTGSPFMASEGLVGGASAERRTAGGTNASRLDSGDDTNNSANDFSLMAPPTPTNNAGVTGQACCSVGFSSSNFTVGEGAGSASVVVNRSPATGTLTVNYSTADGTALAGSDYTATSGTLSFADGESSKSFNVPILSDSLDEYDESVDLALRTPSSGVFSRVEATLKVTGNLVTTVPSAPLGLTATTGSSAGTISLAWNAPSTDGGSAIGSYRLFRGTAATSLSFFRSVPGDARSYLDSGLTQPGRAYYYKVTAVNSIGEGPASSVASALAPATAPGTPTNLSAVPDGLGTTRLTWTAPGANGSAITSYKIYRSFASGAQTFLQQQMTPATTWVDTTCPLTRVCFYKVSAVNGVGEGPLSSETLMAGTS